MKKLVIYLLIVAILSTMLVVPTNAEGNQTIYVSNHSGYFDMEDLNIDEIIELYESITVPTARYTERPSVTAPYAAGELDPSFVQCGLDYLSFLRRLVNITPVYENQESRDWAQYGAVNLAAVNQLTHSPSKPSDMSYDFYNKGAPGMSNLAQTGCSGSTNEEADAYILNHNCLIEAINGCMCDTSNDEVGHRRWFLSPKLKYTGIGNADNKNRNHSYFVFPVMNYDQSVNYNNYDFISWPSSGNMMKEVFWNSSPWSVSLNPQKYETPKAEDLTITLTDISKNKVTVFDKYFVPQSSDGYDFYAVTDTGCGVGVAILFRPYLVRCPAEPLSNEYHVRIEGLKLKNGTPAVIEFDVNFFSYKALTCDHNFINEYIADGDCHMQKVCTLCGATEPLYGEFHQYSESSQIPATCLTGVGHVYQCDRCGNSYTEYDNNTADHTFIEEYVSDTSCIKQRVCTVCGYTEQIDGEVHNYQETETIPATCTTGTEHVYACQHCGDTYAEYDDDALGHDFVEEYVSDNSCEMVGVCSRCGLTEELGVKHNYQEVETIPATCTQGVGHVSQCQRCGDEKTEYGSDLAEHAWVEETDRISYEEQIIIPCHCAVCGAETTKTLCASDVFTDVKPSGWAHQGIDYMWYNGYMAGTSSTTFKPNDSTTRAMAVTVLWRIARKPQPSGENPFTDVKEGSWYADAVCWAYENGITAGTSNTTFSPGKKVTRQEFVVFVYRYLHPDFEVQEDLIAGFADYDKVADWARKAMAWVVENGIVAGTSETTLSPKDKITRAQLATILYRMLTVDEIQ